MVNSEYLTENRRASICQAVAIHYSLITIHYSLHIKLDNRGPCVTFAFLTEPVAFDVRVGFQEVVDSLPQRAGALAMDNRDAAQSGHECLIKVLVQNRDCVVDLHSTQAK